MPIHVVYDHECAACAATYIPYDQDVPCPQCGALEAERFDFIPQVANSLRFNKQKDGTYLPPAWWATSLGDQIIGHLFPLFEAWDVEKPRDFERFARLWYDGLDWGNRPYLKEHVLAMARRLVVELGKDEPIRDPQGL